MGDEESDISIDNNHGAARIRIPSKDMSFVNKLLLTWRMFDLKADGEYDAERHQTIIYISAPGGHTTKLLPLMNSNQDKRQR